MSQRCGKTAQCYDDLLKMMQNKDVSPMVLFSRNKEDDILLYTQQYVDKLNARIRDLQDRIDKAIEYIENQLESTRKSLEYYMKQYNVSEVAKYGRDCKLYANILEILEGEDKDDNR